MGLSVGRPVLLCGILFSDGHHLRERGRENLRADSSLPTRDFFLQKFLLTSEQLFHILGLATYRTHVAATETWQ